MQVVADLVDGALLGLGQVALSIKGVLLEKEADLVAAGEEVVVADMVVAVVAAGGEAGHGVISQREAGEETVCLVEEGLHGGRAQGIRDDEVAIAVEEGNLVCGQAA